MVRFLSIGLLVIFGLLSYRFWYGADSILQVEKLKRTLTSQQQENLALTARNQDIKNKINSLKTYPTAIEEQARYELGMIKRGEQYYQVIEPIE